MQRLAPSLLVAFLCGCPGADAPPPEADLAAGPDLQPPPPPGPAEGCTVYFRELFAKLEGCGLFTYLLDPSAYTRYHCTRYAQRVAGGTVSYHPERLQACRDAVAAAGCYLGALGPLLLPGGCGAFVGNRPDGSGCFDAIECQSGACATSGGCPGTCRDERGMGETCGAGMSCGIHLFCDMTAMPPVCAPLPGPDRPCVQGRCQLGLHCSAGTCRAPQRSGPCLQPSECAPGTRCVGAVPPNTPGQCTPYKQLQQACSNDGECQPGLICTDGICYTYPRAGGSCGTLPGRTRPVLCLDSYCDAAAGMAGRCQPLVPEGGSCDPGRSDQCVADTICSGGRCTRTACSAFR